MSLPSIDDQREVLRSTTISARQRHRILFVGEAHEGSTDVVASLERALEALGHVVFTLDTKRHPQVLDRTSGASGGNAPVYLDVAKIAAVLDRFRPHVVIACAGGIALTPDAASELRRRGVVSIGMTLSDPDVLDSVGRTVTNFDVHTTNSARAVDEYRSRGIDNTIHFPFGIDRGYVLKDVVVKAADHAQVICIGHAAARPERTSVMRALAQDLDVRVYGEGWGDLPGPGPVRGDALVAAARAGSIHVNFPQTRAGFLNVKCGVFESIGSGAVVCIPEFDEMAGLFTYGQEIVGYRDAEDLVASIRHLSAHPDELESVRRRGFQRLLADHLYEHRWNALFDDVYERLAVDGRTLGTVDHEPRHIVISGYFGAANLGDELLLDALASAITDGVPGANVVVAAHSAPQVELTRGLQAFDRRSQDAAAHWAARASAVILGPGGLWHDYSVVAGGGVAGMLRGASVSPSHLAQLPLLVRGFGGDFHVVGLGVGPLQHPEGQAVARFSGELARSISVRDEESRQILESIPGWSARVEVIPDLVFSLPLPPRHSDTVADTLVLNLRPWAPDPDAAKRIARAAAASARVLGLRVVGLPMSPEDTATLRSALAEACPEATVLPSDTPRDELLGALASARVVVAMRLHTNLLAHRLGTPAVGMAYDPKVAVHFAQVERTDFALPLDASEAEISALVARAAQGRLSAQATAAVRSAEERATDALQPLFAMLAEAPARSTVLPAVRGDLWAAPGTQASATGHGPVDLSAGTFASGNLRDPDAVVEHKSARIPTRATFNLVSRAPKRDDFAAFTLKVPVPVGRPTTIDVLVKDGYRADPVMRGRLAVEVLLDDTVLFSYDVAASREANQVSITTTSATGTAAVTARVVARKDCEDWGWGPAAPLSISNVLTRAATGSAGWTASLPVDPPTTRER